MIQTCAICGKRAGGLVADPLHLNAPVPSWPEIDRCDECVGKERPPDPVIEAIVNKVTESKKGKRLASYLPVPIFLRLDYCCASIREAFGHEIYLVGSCLERADFRDVDLSMMMPDEDYARMFPNEAVRLFFNMAVSDWLTARTGLNIDFKFQDTTKANDEHKGPRNPMGVRAELFKREKPR